ncbi:MAG: ATP-dependent DNA ligase [Gemmatimonadales bacterium]|nr:ATP-dependent DNA ligase [Gemmatimonadales bacterium]NIN11137.1 ATP-dependent DNA ligase [Gemmatimonadales bacterium]NIN49736.1 ATP-dependent DNA ligase [Gemmatimonadales bacterium]NIP07200.1 ATP-dependent DNA ligase [Gemmatimonadales bacterium]NIR00413.1 ATP-dependent DNA ligase [Gemmatimonadales bacterium]
MRLHELAETSRRVGEISGRLDKIGLLASLLRRLSPREIDIAIAFLSGSLRQGRVGIGPVAVRQAQPSTAADEPTLELREVDAAFERIAGVSGAGSAGQKARILRELLERATPEEQQFLVRLVFGELRQGALEGVMLEAVAQAANLPSRKVRHAAMTAGDLGTVARAALVDGEEGLSQFGIHIFRPVQPMLAQPASDVTEALRRVGPAVLEYKLDGARIQIHKAGDEVRVFSRRLRDVTAAVPEVVEAALTLPVQDVILDGEVIALRSDGMPRPFQVTMRRFGRKLDVQRMCQELPLSAFLFDVLYLDGQDLLEESQARRSAALVELVPPALVVPRMMTADVEEATAFLEDAIGQGHEGIMAKAVGATYEAGSRGQAWLKLKPAHTLDLVVLAAEWGHGRRRGFLSNLHLGARDPGSGGFAMLGKTFKGMTDETLAWQTAKLLELEIGRDSYTVYVRPELVAEVAFNDVQASPQYPAGLALRFARLKGYRADKTVDQADTVDTVREIFLRTSGR